MALPITVPYTFANATTSIPLSQLDTDISTVYAAVNGIANGVNALANVNITGGVIDNVPIGATTPANGTFTNLNVSANATFANLSSSVTLSANGNAYMQIVSLTDGATITPNLAAGNNFTVTLGGNRVLANATNLTAGQSGVIYVVQDGTGSRTLSYGTMWRFPSNTAPTLSTAANAIDVLPYFVRSTTSITVTSLANVGP
jgi:hypothetical protein